MTLSTKMKTKPTGRYFMPAILVCGLVLDVFDILGRDHASDALAQVACTLRPFSTIASPFVTNELMAFANEQCLSQPHERAFSIIFYMTKLALALTAIPVSWGVMLLMPANFLQVRDKYVDRMDNGYRLEQFKKYLVHIFMLLLVCTYGVLLFSTRIPAQFIIRPMHKLFEDGVDSLVFYAGVDISLYAVLLTGFLLRKLKGLTQCLLTIVFLLASLASTTLARAQNISDDPRFGESRNGSLAKDNVSIDTTPVEFFLGKVHYRVPRNYISDMDDPSGKSHEAPVDLQLTFPGFDPLTEQTKDCLTLAPAYRPKGCVPVIVRVFPESMSDETSFNNLKKHLRSQTPKPAPFGFEVYEQGPDNARIEIYRKQTNGHLLVIECTTGDIHVTRDPVCDNSSALPTGNGVHYFLYKSQLKDAEQIDAGVRALINSFIIDGGKQ